MSATKLNSKLPDKYIPAVGDRVRLPATPKRDQLIGRIVQIKEDSLLWHVFVEFEGYEDKEYHHFSIEKEFYA